MEEVDDAGSGELTELIHCVHGSENASTVSELLAAESEIPVCSEFTESSWDEECLDELSQDNEESYTHDDEDGDQDSPEDTEPLPPRLKNLREVMESLEDIWSYLELNGHTAAATETEGLVNTVARLQCSVMNRTIQSKLTQYFSTE